jgi:hypothetical protein
MKSFLQGKKAHSAPALRAPTVALPPRSVSCETSRTAANGQPRAHSPAGGGANVEVVKEGDKVVRLIVTCVCGERVEVECLYPAGS